jgi:hypothetical protein
MVYSTNVRFSVSSFPHGSLPFELPPWTPNWKNPRKVLSTISHSLSYSSWLVLDFSMQASNRVQTSFTSKWMSSSSGRNSFHTLSTSLVKHPFLSHVCVVPSALQLASVPRMQHCNSSTTKRKRIVIGTLYLLALLVYLVTEGLAPSRHPVTDSKMNQSRTLCSYPLIGPLLTFLESTPIE